MNSRIVLFFVTLMAFALFATASPRRRQEAQRRLQAVQGVPRCHAGGHRLEDRDIAQDPPARRFVLRRYRPMLSPSSTPHLRMLCTASPARPRPLCNALMMTSMYSGRRRDARR
ncbi:hypothetical protein VTO73DRAFT_14216 [Trametes versicolor]